MQRLLSPVPSTSHKMSASSPQSQAVDKLNPEENPGFKEQVSFMPYLQVGESNHWKIQKFVEKRVEDNAEINSMQVDDTVSTFKLFS